MGTGLKTFIVSDADAEKLAAILEEHAVYRPDYFGTLATTVLNQLEEQTMQLPYQEELHSENNIDA